MKQPNHTSDRIAHPAGSQMERPDVGRKTERMRRTFLTINYVALVGALMGWFYVARAVTLGGPSRVTELDRNGVFDEAKLREYSPQLAENLRHNVGMWIQEPTRSAAIRGTQCLAGLALLNIAGYHLLKVRKRNGQPSAGGNAAAPRATL
jgi:hypothetical protein